MLLLGLAGTGVCLTLLIRFLLMIINNGLPWNPSDGVRGHYLAVGDSFSRGFSVGFFFCFFLALAALGWIHWWRQSSLSAPLQVSESE